MGKRNERSKISETQNGRGADEQEEEGEKGGFFACYLLTSLSPRFKGHSYIGFTVNPKRRIRQHNGEIRCGAWRTKSKRPWEMILCIYGFPTNVAALQFEWAWQHPIESLAVRKSAVAFKSLSGIANKIKLAYTMLSLPAWQSLNLTVNFFSTKYTKHSAGCPSLPEHMKVQVCSMDELPCYTDCDQNLYENKEWDDDEECDGTSGAYASSKDGTDADHQKKECDETEGAYRLIKGKLADATVHSSTDHWNSTEEISPKWIRHIEENRPRQPRDLPVQTEDHGQPFCLHNSPGRALSALFTSSYGIAETVEDRDKYQLIGECSVELDRRTRKQLLTKTAAEKSQPLIKSPTIPCEVEVIDVITPSPSFRINSRRKKIRVSIVCPEIIDLTKSPIFV